MDENDEHWMVRLNPVFRPIWVRIVFMLGIQAPFVAGMFMSRSPFSMDPGSYHAEVLQDAIIAFRDANHQEWPDSLTQVKRQIDFDKLDRWYTTASTLGDLMYNPLTGDNPGYEYCKPTSSDVEREPLIYQLRDGKREQGLRVFYSDGSDGFPELSPEVDRKLRRFFPRMLLDRD